MHAQGRGNASGRPEVLYALQGMLAHKAFDALQKSIERLNAYAAQGEYSSGWGAVSLSILIIINDTSPHLAGLACNRSIRNNKYHLCSYANPIHDSGASHCRFQGPPVCAQLVL